MWKDPSSTTAVKTSPLFVQRFSTLSYWEMIACWRHGLCSSFKRLDLILPNHSYLATMIMSHTDFEGSYTMKLTGNDLLNIKSIWTKLLCPLPPMPQPNCNHSQITNQRQHRLDAIVHKSSFCSPIGQDEIQFVKSTSMGEIPVGALRRDKNWAELHTYGWMDGWKRQQRTFLKGWFRFPVLCYFLCEYNHCMFFMYQ